MKYVTLDHKSSHMGQLVKIEMYTSINKLSIGLWTIYRTIFVRVLLFEYLKVQKNVNIEKIAFNVVYLCL